MPLARASAAAAPERYQLHVLPLGADACTGAARHETLRPELEGVIGCFVNVLALRTDLSATLFLSDPESYDGGELVIEGAFGAQAVKLPAGHMILYPASSLHRVEPVTRGVRVASFFWLQSMVRDGEARRHLFELDEAIQTLAADRGQGDPAIIQLTGVYHNLLRRWGDA